jgi:hypothetical protein
VSPQDDDQEKLVGNAAIASHLGLTLSGWHYRRSQHDYSWLEVIDGQIASEVSSLDHRDAIVEADISGSRREAARAGAATRAGRMVTDVSSGGVA